MRGERLHPHDASGPPIDDEVDPTERLAAREGLDDADAVDQVCESAVGVTGGDDVHQPARQASRNPKDLRVGLARRQIRGLLESLAAAARVGGDDDDVGPGRSKLRRARGDRRPERRDPQSLDIGGKGRLQRRSSSRPRTPTLMPAASTSADGRTLGHSTGRSRRLVDQVRREERIPRLDARAERAARVARQLPRRR